MAITDAKLDRVSVVGGGSVYTAVENLLLACRAEGLGCVLTTLLCAMWPSLFFIDQELLRFPLRDAPSPLILSKPSLSCVPKEASNNSQTLPARSLLHYHFLI